MAGSGGALGIVTSVLVQLVSPRPERVAALFAVPSLEAADVCFDEGGNHVNVLGADREADRIEERVLRLATALGGTISAEHGVGVSKAKHLGLVGSPAEVALLRSLKVAVDPAGTMNPGVVPVGD